MINRKDHIKARIGIAKEQIGGKISLPSNINEDDLVTLYFIRDAHTSVMGHVHYGTFLGYEALLKIELEQLVDNGMIFRRDLDRLKLVFDQFQAIGSDGRFSYVFTFLDLVATIPDKNAKTLLKKQHEEKFQERARKNKVVARPTRGKRWGPPSDGNEFG